MGGSLVASSSPAGLFASLNHHTHMAQQMFGDYQLPKMSTLTNLMDFDSKVSKHLRDVYATLSLPILAATIGSYVHLQTHLGGTFSAIGCVILAVYLGSTATGSSAFDPTRFGLLLGFGFLKGLS